MNAVLTDLAGHMAADLALIESAAASEELATEAGDIGAPLDTVATDARPEPMWAELANPFDELSAPPFPVDHLPRAMATYCHGLSAQSGFDAGGYGFCLLVATSNLIDHRAKLTAGPLCVPPFMWGMLVSPSGAGKSPIINGGMKFVNHIHKDLVHRSGEALDEFRQRTAVMSKGNLAKQEKPRWEQLVASDTTVEGLGVLLKDNPSGVLLHFDEITEFIGRMDAYSGSGAGGKDRGTYLQAFDGGAKTINRKSADPVALDNFSVGVIAGGQPEKLANLFKKSNGADGLFQRFIVYAIPAPGDVNYGAPDPRASAHECQQISNTIHQWTRQGVLNKEFSVSRGALASMESFHSDMRTIALRTVEVPSNS